MAAVDLETRTGVRTSGLLRGVQNVNGSVEQNLPANLPISDRALSPAVAGPQTVLGKSEGLVSREERKELDLQALFEAAEGIRTLDLLHGKQTL